MKEFDTIAGINITGVFPDAVATDDTVVGAFDGTQMFSDWLNEHFGWIQDALTQAGITPSGTPDVNGTSDITDAIHWISHPPGTGAIWWQQNDPAASSPAPRMLLLDGDLILVADYAALVTATWCGSSDNGTADSFYRTNAGDTIRADAGTHMRLPDMRGQFLRGLDLAGSVDPGGASRIVGSVQGHIVDNHRHYGMGALSSSIGVLSQIQTSSALPTGFTKVSLVGSVDMHKIGKDGDFLGGLQPGYVGPPDVEGYSDTSQQGALDREETRPINTACHFAIWY